MAAGLLLRVRRRPPQAPGDQGDGGVVARQAMGPSTRSGRSSRSVLVGAVGPGGALRPVPYLRRRIAGRIDRLRHPLAGLAADDVAEGFLVALGAPVGAKAEFGLGLLVGAPLPVAAVRPRRARLAEAPGPVDRNRQDEEADRAVHQPLLGEAGGDEADHDGGVDDAADGLAERV